MPGPAASASLRAFVGIAAPPALLPAIREIQRQWQALLPQTSIRWTRPDQLHLTLRFLGDVPLESIEPLRVALDRTAAAAMPFGITLAGAGCFPSERNPSVLWLGIAGELGALSGLQAAVESGVAPFSLHSETRAFHPHLTIGRLKPGGSRQPLPAPPAAALGGPVQEPWRVTKLELIQSFLTPEGSRYKTLGEFPLGRGPECKENG